MAGPGYDGLARAVCLSLPLLLRLPSSGTVCTGTCWPGVDCVAAPLGDSWYLCTVPTHDTVEKELQHTV